MIDVSVPEIFEGQISALNINTTGVADFFMEFYNTGSIAYMTRIRLDIYDKNGVIFTGWSKKKALLQGNRKVFEIKWPGSEGNYTALLRSYSGNEIFEHGFYNITVSPGAPGDAFEIEEFRTYDDFVVFDVRFNGTIENVSAVPTRYPKLWVFEQDSIPKLKNSKTIKLAYDPSFFTENAIEITVASSDGRYLSRRNFLMSKESGFFYFFHYMLDNMKLWISK